MPLHKRARPGSTPQQEGRRFERFWAKLFGVETVRGSGNQWFAKLDVGDGSILWSCKNTIKDSFSISSALMREAEQAVYQDGSEKTIPGIAVSTGSEVFVTLRAEDFLRLLASDAAQYIVPSKGEQKRARARVPALLRDEE